MWYSARLSNGLGFLRQYYDRGDRGVKVNITLEPNSKCILFVWQDDSSGLHTLIYNLECKIFIRDQYFWKERRWSRIVKRDKLNRNAGSPKLWQILEQKLFMKFACLWADLGRHLHSSYTLSPEVACPRKIMTWNKTVEVDPGVDSWTLNDNSLPWRWTVCLSCSMI